MQGTELKETTKVNKETSKSAHTQEKNTNVYMHVFVCEEATCGVSCLAEGVDLRLNGIFLASFL